MGKLFIGVFGLIFGIYCLTAVVTHIWTVIIAFQEAGFIGATVSFFLPFLSELYWMLKMFGENDTYAYIALVHLILAGVFALVTKGEGFN